MLGLGSLTKNTKYERNIALIFQGIFRHEGNDISQHYRK